MTYPGSHCKLGAEPGFKAGCSGPNLGPACDKDTGGPETGAQTGVTAELAPARGVAREALAVQGLLRDLCVAGSGEGSRVRAGVPLWNDTSPLMSRELASERDAVGGLGKPEEGSG